MLALITFAIFAVITISLLIVWFIPPTTPRRYTGTLKRHG